MFLGSGCVYGRGAAFEWFIPCVFHLLDSGVPQPRVGGTGPLLGILKQDWKNKDKKGAEGSYLCVCAEGNQPEPHWSALSTNTQTTVILLPPEWAFNSLISVGSCSSRISYRNRPKTKQKKLQLKVLQAANVNMRGRGGHLVSPQPLRQEGHRQSPYTITTF